MKIDPTLKEVFSSVIGQLRAITINRIVEEDLSESEREELKEQQLLLRYEEIAVLGDDDIARSIQDKVRRLYAPLLREFDNLPTGSYGDK